MNHNDEKRWRLAAAAYRVTALWRRWAAVCTLILLAFTTAARAEPLDIALTDDFPPYSTGTVAVDGVFHRIVTGALDQAGIAYNILGYPWPRLVYETRTAKLDASFPWRAKPERFKRYHMIGPLMPEGSNTVLWQRASSGITWDKITELADQRIGAVRKFRYPAIFEHARPQLDIYAGRDESLLLKMLAQKRLDLVIGDARVLVSQARTTSGIAPSDFKQAGPALDTVQRYIVVPRSKPEVAAKLRAAIKDFKATEAYREIVGR